MKHSRLRRLFVLRNYSRLRSIGFMLVGSALLGILVSSFVDWRTPAWGVLIWDHRTDVLLGAGGLALLGGALIVGSGERRGRLRGLLTGMLLTVSAILFCLSGFEWYLRHPSRLYLRVSPQILRIVRRLVEPGIGLRIVPRAGIHHSIEPFCNIPLTRKDQDLIVEERQEVEFYIDSQGFPNRWVPTRADILLLGDSFAEVAQVPWDQRWVSMVQHDTGLAVYNMGHGGYCPSQEVELYARYGDIKGVRLVMIGVYGINDMRDERNFTRFLESGLGPREWALEKARHHFPRPTFGFIQAAEKWWDEHVPSSPVLNELEPIRVANTDPATIVSYFPACQLRAWQCVDREPGDNPGVASMEASITRLSQLCEAQGRRAAVVYFPLKQTIHPPDPDGQEPWVAFLRRALPWIEREGWDREKIVAAGRLLLEGDRRLASHLSDVCDSLAVPFHSTIPALEREVQMSRNLTYYRFDTHWNTRGNAAVGRDLAAWIGTVWEG